jgi:hypothetical protein
MSLADQILNRLSGLPGWKVSDECVLVLRQFIDECERETAEWRDRYEQLYQQLSASSRRRVEAAAEGEYEEYRGLAWRRIDSRSVEPVPHCRRCKRSMVAFPSAGLWCCDACNETAPYVRHPHAAE